MATTASRDGVPAGSLTFSAGRSGIGWRAVAAVAAVLLLGGMVGTVLRGGSDDTPDATAGTVADPDDDPSGSTGLTTPDTEDTEDTTTGTENTTTTEAENTTTTRPGTTTTRPGDDDPVDVTLAAEPTEVDAGETAVVNASGQAVDIYLDGTLVASDVADDVAAASVAAPDPGQYELEVHPAVEDPPERADDRAEPALASATIAVADDDSDQSQTIRIGPTISPTGEATGDLTVDLTVDDLRPVAAGNGRIVVRDQFGLGSAATVTDNGRSVEVLTPGGEVSFEASAGPHVIELRPTTGPTLRLSIEVEDRSATDIALVKGDAAGTVSAAIHVRRGLATLPETIPTGNSGLRSDSASAAASVNSPVSVPTASWQSLLPPPTASITEGDADARPVGITAPAIGLDAPIDPVGVDAVAALEIPAADRVGWYEDGAAPGRAGAAVLAAHVDWDGRPGAFFGLTDLRPGDTVTIALSDGSVVTHVVTARTSYDRDRLPTEELFGDRDTPVLRLITCGGPFDPGTGHYERNVVVTAVPLTAPTARPNAH